MEVRCECDNLMELTDTDSRQEWVDETYTCNECGKTKTHRTEFDQIGLVTKDEISNEDDGMEICYECSHDQNHCICKSNEILDVLEEKEKTEFEKLKEYNNKLREKISKLIGRKNPNYYPTWALINEIIENELQQEELCEQ